MLASTTLGRKRVAQRLAAAISGTQVDRISRNGALSFDVDRWTRQSFSTSSRHAVVDHSAAYEASMEGRHGQQLSLAKIDGLGKDDSPYDPFLEYELEDTELEDLEGTDDQDVEDEANPDEIEDEDGEADAFEMEQDDEVPLYKNDGSLRWKKSQLALFRAGAPAGGLFAVVELAGTQHKVTVDDVIVCSKLKPIETYSAGSVHTLKDVLLVGSSHLTLVGMPSVKGGEVDVMVEEITRDEKVIIFKRRRRKNSKRKNGFRRDVTLLRVLDIRMPDVHKGHNHVARVSVDSEV